MKLTEQEREDLHAIIRKRKRKGSAALARRARCVLLWADGERRVDIRSKLACNDGFVTRWTQAFQMQELAGLVSLHPGRAPERPVAKLEARGAQQDAQAQAVGWFDTLEQPQAGRRAG